MSFCRGVSLHSNKQGSFFFKIVSSMKFLVNYGNIDMNAAGVTQKNSGVNT